MKEPTASTRESFGITLKDLGYDNPAIVALGGDLNISTFASLFAKEFPDRFFDLGAAEQNMLSMAAGLAALTQIKQPGLYDSIFENTQTLVNGFQALADKHNISLTTNIAGSMFGIFFTDVEKVTNYKQAINCNTEQFNKFYHGMLEQGVYLAPASYEAGFVSKAHDAAVIEQTLAAADKVFSTL